MLSRPRHSSTPALLFSRFSMLSLCGATSMLYPVCSTLYAHLPSMRIYPSRFGGLGTGSGRNWPIRAPGGGRWRPEQGSSGRAVVRRQQLLVPAQDLEASGAAVNMQQLLRSLSRFCRGCQHAPLTLHHLLLECLRLLTCFT